MVTEWPLLAAWLKGRDHPSLVVRRDPVIEYLVAKARIRDVEEEARKALQLRWWPSQPEAVRNGRGL